MMSFNHFQVVEKNQMKYTYISTNQDVRISNDKICKYKCQTASVQTIKYYKKNYVNNPARIESDCLFKVGLSSFITSIS